MADQVVDDLHDSDDEDEVDGRPSKLRGSNGFTEVFNILLALALNEMSTKIDSLSQNDQYIMMKALCTNWVDLLQVDYPFLLEYMKKAKVTCAQLKQKIAADTGCNLLRKAKMAVSFVNNHLACSWVEPIFGASGKGRDGE